MYLKANRQPLKRPKHPLKNFKSPQKKIEEGKSWPQDVAMETAEPAEEPPKEMASASRGFWRLRVLGLGFRGFGV